MKETNEPGYADDEVGTLEVLTHNFTEQPIVQTKRDYRVLREEQNKILDLQMKLSNTKALEPNFSKDALIDSDRKIYDKPAEDIFRKIKEAEAEIERKDILVRIMHKVERFLGRRA